MLIKAAPRPAAAANPGRGGGWAREASSLWGPGSPGSMSAGQENTQEWSLHPALPHSPCQPCSWPLCVLFPLTVTTLTTQLQVHAHQEVFLSKPFFSAFSPHGYIWFLQHKFVYIASGRGGDSWTFFFFFVFMKLFFGIFSVLENSCSGCMMFICSASHLWTTTPYALLLAT